MASPIFKNGRVQGLGARPKNMPDLTHAPTATELWQQENAITALRKHYMYAGTQAQDHTVWRQVKQAMQHVTAGNMTTKQQLCLAKASEHDLDMLDQALLSMTPLLVIKNHSTRFMIYNHGLCIKLDKIMGVHFCEIVTGHLGCLQDVALHQLQAWQALCEQGVA